VATSREKRLLSKILGEDNDQLLAIQMDVTNAQQVQKAVNQAISRFGSIDVLVNNAGFGLMGFFEEMTIEDVQTQFATNLVGAMNVAWAILPSMRSARSGRIFNVSSLGGIVGAQMGSLYCASKFALEGFSECLSKEVSPFGIIVTLVEPGPFRTGFLSPQSMRFGSRIVADYDDRRSELRAAFEGRNGHQPGDPYKLADAIATLAREPNPPLRFFAGSVALDAASNKLLSMQSEIVAWRNLSLATDGQFSDTNIEGLLGQLKD
jgi:NAD(P)-dependent dehydrogenase (short-subunit alcohol dehydrogenase family)